MREHLLLNLEILVITSLVYPTLFPEQTFNWLLFVTIVVYFTTSHKVYVTTKATGHHKFGTGNTYIDRKTKLETPLNENEWNAKGNEHCYGFIGFGRMTFVNSFHVPGWCEFVSLRLEVPHFFSSGIEFGIVQGYKAYQEDGQMTAGIPVGRSYLFFMAPTIRWSAAHQQDKFISIRQFGSATVTTEGRIEL